MIITKIFALFTLIITSIAVPVALEDTDFVLVTNTTSASEASTPDFVGGTCSFHNQIIQECRSPTDDPKHGVSWWLQTTTSIAWLIDGAGTKRRPAPPLEEAFNKKTLDSTVLRLYKLGGLPEPFYITSYYNERETFRYKSVQWDEYKASDGAWCERGEWTRGPRNCQIEGERRDLRTADMDCFFPC